MWLLAGDRFAFGYSVHSPYYGIWDRTKPGPPIRKFPCNEHGKSDGEAQFAELEPRAIEGGPETRPPAVNTYGF